MAHKFRGVFAAAGLLLLATGVGYYAAVWLDNAKNAELYQLYSAGRLGNVASNYRELWLDAKLSIDRARFVAGGVSVIGLLGLGVALYRPFWRQSVEGGPVLGAAHIRKGAG